MDKGTLTAIIHFQTPDLLEEAVRSFRKCCPHDPLLILDNGSADGSRSVVRCLAEELPGVGARYLDENIYHGPAMDLVLQEAIHDTVFFLDSDTVTLKGGFIAPMRSEALRPETLAAGEVVTVDGRGFASRTGIPVPVSAYMMINRTAYLELPPFVHHGLPVLQTCKEAQQQGLRIRSWPVAEHVNHLGRGTAERFGYGLGLRSRLSFLLHKLGL
ncbi:MAG: glycosyltransferase [Rhodothermales bacterium]|nr:glycosyltransferase [Rhodothermales bacterium]MBO6779492.1 glycosyltransferase [Rhodothermales bacterium]